MLGSGPGGGERAERGGSEYGARRRQPAQPAAPSPFDDDDDLPF
jgi:hypothetical protein